jgi:hypothetical protein
MHLIHFLYGQFVGPEGVNNNCGKMAHRETMARDVTVLCYVQCV